MLWRVFNEIAGGVYVDFSPGLVSQTFYNIGWQGFNIDSNADNLVRLQRPRDTNICVSSSDEFATIWRDYLTTDRPVHFAHIPSHCVVAALGNSDWQSARPWVFVVQQTSGEHQNVVPTDWMNVLTSSDYQFAYQDGLFWLFVAHEHASLLESLKHPPNIFDNFSLRLDPEPLMRQVGSHDTAVHYAPGVLMSLKASAAHGRATELKLKGLLSHVRFELDATKNELETLRSSTSWRITSPLRLTVEFLRTEILAKIRNRLREAVETLAPSLQKRPRLDQALRRLINRTPGLKRFVSRAAGISISQGTADGVRELDAPPIGGVQGMPVRAQHMYAELQAAILDKNRG